MSPDGASTATRGRNLKAVLLGGLVNTACSFAYSFVSILTLMVVINVRHAPVAETERYANSLAFLIPAWIAGTASALLGGFVAARIAQRRELVSAAISALPNMVITLALILTTPGQMRIPTWYLIASYTAVIPAAIRGGQLGVRRKRTLAAAMAS
jgi:hypothetical protein